MKKIAVICKRKDVFDSYVGDIVYAELKWRKDEQGLVEKIRSNYCRVSNLTSARRRCFSEVVYLYDAIQLNDLCEIRHTVNQHLIRGLNYVH